MSEKFELSFKTKGNARPNNKPRVFFTCHPEDFKCSFEKICKDVFASHDCTIYYTKDMTTIIPEENRETDLEQMNLFVIPVTFRLLTQPNRAMDSDFYFAKERHIPVLPIMMEAGIDNLYGQKFGPLQYLYPYSGDLTEIPYEEKLYKYLECVLISDELAQRVRYSFDTYAFLSYRKKDRKYANELLKLIHSQPECRTIAIWFDEFLVPGESFEDNIKQMLSRSKLFLLVVTPHIFEKIIDENGVVQDNYVVRYELPAALKNKEEKGIDIFAVEMEETDRASLLKIHIEDCVYQYNKDNFRGSLVSRMSKIVKNCKSTNAERIYLMGIAYLNGVGVERNYDLAIEMLTEAASLEWLDAMNLLGMLYQMDSSKKQDLKKSLFWLKKCVDALQAKNNAPDRKTLIVLNNLAEVYCKDGQYSKAINIQRHVCDIMNDLLGHDNRESLTALYNLSRALRQDGKINQSLSVGIKAYEMMRRHLGETDSDTLAALLNVGELYGLLNKRTKGKEICERAYFLTLKEYGTLHPDSIAALYSYAISLGEVGDHVNAAKYLKKAYIIRKELDGDYHPETLRIRSQYARALSYLNMRKKALAIQSETIRDMKECLGNEHPLTLTALSYLGDDLLEQKKTQKAESIFRFVYITRKKQLGEMHPDTMISLINLASALVMLNRMKEAEQLYLIFMRQENAKEILKKMILHSFSDH